MTEAQRQHVIAATLIQERIYDALDSGHQIDSALIRRLKAALVERMHMATPDRWPTT